MTKIEFLQLAASDRKEVFIEVATQTGMTPFAVEKDWWVSRCLEIILLQNYSFLKLKKHSKHKAIKISCLTLSKPTKVIKTQVF